MSSVEHDPHKVPYDISCVYGSHYEDGVFERYQKGDQNANVWEYSDVLQQVSRLQPKLLTVDSMYPQIEGISVYGEGREDTAIWMPGKPDQINREGRVLVVAGDSFLEGVDFLPELKAYDPYRVAVIKQIEKEREKKFGKGDHFKTSWLIKGVEPETVALFASFSLLTASLLRAQGKFSNRRNLTRRDFLKYTGIFTGLTILAGTGVKVGTADRLVDGYFDAEDPNEKTTYQELAEIFGAELTIEPKDWLNARNALYVLKTKDAIDIVGPFNGSPSVIIAGSHHEVGMEDLLQSDEACREALLQYTEKMFGVIDHVAALDKNKNTDPTLGIRAKVQLASLLSKILITDAYMHPTYSGKKIPIFYPYKDYRYESKRVQEALKSLELPVISQ